MMELKLRYVVLVAGLFLGINQNHAQDIHFAQHNLQPILVNPAAAGVFNGWERVSLAHRQQWITLGSPFITSTISADLNLFKKDKGNSLAYLGLGLNFYNDIAGNGDLGSNKASIAINGILNVADGMTLSAGIQVGGAQGSANIQNLTWGNQFTGDGFNTDITPNEGNSAATTMYPDIGAGIFYKISQYKVAFKRISVVSGYAGVSALHVNSPSIQFVGGGENKLFTKFTGIIGSDIEIERSKFAIAPRFMFATQGPNREYLVTLEAKYRIKDGTKYTGIYNNSYLTFGGNFRVGDALGPMVGFEIANYKLSLAYELVTSSLSGIAASQGGFEISFMWANYKNALFTGRRSKGFKTMNGK